MTRSPRFPVALDRLHKGTRSASQEVLRPQRPLQHAAEAAARQAAGHGAPQGIGMDSAAVRERMVQRLRADGHAVDEEAAGLVDTDHQRLRRPPVGASARREERRQQGALGGERAVLRLAWNEIVTVKRALDIGAQTLLARSGNCHQAIERTGGRASAARRKDASDRLCSGQ